MYILSVYVRVCVCMCVRAHLCVCVCVCVCTHVNVQVYSVVSEVGALWLKHTTCIYISMHASVHSLLASFSTTLLYTYACTLSTCVYIVYRLYISSFNNYMQIPLFQYPLPGMHMCILLGYIIIYILCISSSISEVCFSLTLMFCTSC